jgi:hypothetical protein
MKLDWEHYPENDLAPEHYSSPFGIILLNERGKWEAWATSAAFRPVWSAEELQIEILVCVSTHRHYCKVKIEALVERHQLNWKQNVA